MLKRLAGIVKSKSFLAGFALGNVSGAVVSIACPEVGLYIKKKLDEFKAKGDPEKWLS